MSTFRWRQVSSVSEEPGIYAWYYRPEISRRDLDEMVINVNQHKHLGDLDAASEAVRKFLYDSLFVYFEEQPYQALLRGPLKPQYEGTLEHKTSISATLIKRLVEDPTRLTTIKQVLEAAFPEFASPLYIGMSGNLRRRLLRHKALIEQYREQPFSLIQYDGSDEEEQRDHSFAREVQRRHIPPACLIVAVEVIPGSLGEHVDLENILNRINFPLLGRN